MKGSRLQQLVGEERDLTPLFESFQRDRNDRDPMMFARWLHDRGLLSTDKLRDYLLAGDIEFTIAEATQHIRTHASSRFDLLGMVGRGNMGEVHVARDRDLNRNVAVKLMEPSLASDPKLARRFYTEAQITAQLDHPAIVPVFGVERGPNGSLSYAMRIVRGRTLRDFLTETRAFYERGRSPDATHALQARLLLFEDLCNALSYVHARGVIHRDLKPDNIMVGPFGEVLIMDWGIAKVLGDKEPLAALATPEDGDLETEIGDAVGTPKYMSPEQAQGLNDTLDARSDQYALGLLLFELVALKQANPGKNAVTSWGAACHGKTAPFTHAFGEAIPRDLMAIVGKAIAREPADRYANVAQLAEDLRRHLRDEELIARRDTLGQRVQRQIGRHRQAVAIALVALLMLLVALVSSTVVIGVSALAAYAVYADAREARLGRVLSIVTDQGHALDHEFARYAGEVRGLRAAAELALRDASPEPRPIWFAEMFHDPDTAPSDLAMSPVYEAPASLTTPDVVTAPRVDREAIRPTVHRLLDLQPQMLAMLARSASQTLDTAPPAEQRRALLEVGAPMIWAYVATEEGVLVGMPGVGDYPDGYDPRAQPWYRLGLRAEAVSWEVNLDESGQGLLLTAVTPVLDAAGHRAGVAALDLGVRHVTDALLAPPDLGGPVEALLMDRTGRVLVSTAHPDASGTKYPFRHPIVHARVVDGQPSGWVTVGAELVVWTQVDQLGWTYVVVGETDALVNVFADPPDAG